MSASEKLEYGIDKIRLFSRYRREINKINSPKRKAIWSQITLTKEQMNDIDYIYINNYGKKIPYIWHRYFTAYTGNFDARYFPEHLYIPRFEFFMNRKNYAEVFSDKNIVDMLCTGNYEVIYPHVFVSRCNGIFRDSNMNIITQEKVCDILTDIGEVFIKPSVSSCSGQNCRVLTFKNGVCEVEGENKSVLQILEMYGTDFIVSEKVICCDSIRKIYSKSVNTFRIITYIWDNKVYHTPALMRIGRGGGSC